MRAPVALPLAGRVTVVGDAEISGATDGPENTCRFKDPEVADPGFGFVTETATFPRCELAAVPVKLIQTMTRNSANRSRNLSPVFLTKI